MMLTTFSGRFLVALVATMLMASVDGFSVQPKAAVRSDSRLWAGTPMVPYKVRFLLPSENEYSSDFVATCSSSQLVVGIRRHYFFVGCLPFLTL